MKKTMLTLAAGGLILATGFSNLFAQDDDDDGAVPVELYTCKYAEGKGPSDLDAVVADWNAWADEREMNDYSAWTLVPFYSSPEQDFDVAWMGVVPTGKGMGAVQDDWIANGGKLAAAFDGVTPCDSHSMFAAVQFKDPPEREDPSNVVIAFSDCKVGEGKSFTNDVAPALTAWAEYRTSQGSTAGHWVFFPVYGGGGEEFDFKFVASHGNFEEQGVDFDNYEPGKAREIFPAGLLSCDSSRVYIATTRRMGESDDD